MCAFGHQRFALAASLAAATLTFACPSTALELRVATWNLEHLADTHAEGCVGREDADYSALAERIDALDADVVAFQEVENTAAAQRVFDEARWSVEVSTRPSTGSGPPCRGRPSARLGRLATGIAVRAGLEYTRNADFSAIAGGNRFLRWGTDVTVTRGGEDLRVLSVHLKSGCWSADQDDNASSAATCTTLREQMETLAEWIAERREEETPLVIVGDFNRRMAVPGDWAWVLLSEDNPGLSLITAGRISRCDARYPEYIDHVLFDADTGVSMPLGSFEEAERSTPHPDHCAVSARFRVAPPDAPLTVPFLVAASGAPPWGFVRMVNRSDEAGTVDIVAIDDTGERFGPVTLSLDAQSVGAFSSRGLEKGAAHRGLSTGVGDGSGHWRLEFDTNLDVVTHAYARGPESFVSLIDTTVAAIDDDGYRYDVRFFNPGTNTVKPSALRLVNPGDAAADITIRARDDEGDDAPKGEVTLSVAAGTAVELSAQALERGDEGFQGRLGDGAGKWRLTVHSERFLHVLSLVRGRGGYLASLSR